MRTGLERVGLGLATGGLVILCACGEEAHPVVSGLPSPSPPAVSTPRPPAATAIPIASPQPHAEPTSTVPPVPKFTAEISPEPALTRPPETVGAPGPVPVVPNGSDVSAAVEALEIVTEKPRTYLLAVRILSSHDVPGVPNLTKSRVGESVEVTVLGEDLSGVELGDVISAKVQYRGDERGGGFYARDVTRLADPG